ncbi:MAG TPA: ribonuclease [Janthinobacterium sp.]|nr:ribonuclease [Janthinobacterium sp.]
MITLSVKKICGLALVCGLGAAADAQAFDYLVLAASWEPGFCATTGGKPECATLAGTRSASKLALHGYWPNNYQGQQPFYCDAPANDVQLDKNHAWCRMDTYAVSDATLKNLGIYMPGLESCLDKHEWYKHGTCAGTPTPDDYWNVASNLMNHLGNTSFNGFIAKYAGVMVTREHLLTAFEDSFGANTRNGVALKCTKYKGKNYLSEAWIMVNSAAVDQFPGAAALVTNSNIKGNCPLSGIYIASAH